MTANRGAIFLDRDNTIVDDPGFLHEPDKVRLRAGAAEGLAAMAAARWPLIIVTNQSGIGRGLFGAGDYRAVMQRMESLLEPHGVRFLASYYCPHNPEAGQSCDCRKPGVALFRQAAGEHGIDLGASWFVGDRWRDVAPAMALGGRGVLVNADPLSEDSAEANRHNIRVVPDLASAAGIIGKRP